MRFETTAFYHRECEMIALTRERKGNTAQLSYIHKRKAQIEKNTDIEKGGQEGITMD